MAGPLATGLQPASAFGGKPANRFAQVLRDQPLAFGRRDFFAVQFAHIKTVDRRAAFGHDAGADNVHRQFKKGLGDRIEQAELVFGFDLDERARLGGLVVEMNLRRHLLADIGVIDRTVRDLTGDEGGQIHGLPVQDFFQQSGKFVVLFARPQIAGAGVVDEKVVERDAVGARENLRAQDVQPGGAQRAGDLAEQSGPVPGADFDDVVTPVRFVQPRRHGRQGAVALLDEPVHEPVGEFEVVENLPGGVDLKIAGR